MNAHRVPHGAVEDRMGTPLPRAAYAADAVEQRARCRRQDVRFHCAQARARPRGSCRTRKAISARWISLVPLMIDSRRACSGIALKST